MPPTPPTRPAAHRQSLYALALLCIPLMLGLFVVVDADRATLVGLEGPTCPVGASLGEAACPGCGLIRSTALVLQGQAAAATAVHPAGWLVVLLCIGGVLVHGDIVRRGRRTAAHRRLLSWGYVSFVVGLAATWVVRLMQDVS